MRLGSGLRICVAGPGGDRGFALLADQKAREVETVREGVEAGREGDFEWERRATVTTVPEELTVSGTNPIRLFRVTVQVHWGGRSVEVATLRTAREPLP